MADHQTKKFQFADPEAGADLELRLGLSKSTNGGKEKEGAGQKGWEHFCITPWNGQKPIMPYGSIMLPSCPPPQPQPPTVPLPAHKPSGSGDHQFSTSIPYTGGGSSGSTSSKDSDARSSRQVINATMADIGEKKMELMETFGKKPCVVTTGDGPQGRTVAGLLTKYDTEEDIRILCVCHGEYFSPGGFVNHAGAASLSHPLRKIVVLPSH